MAQPPWCLPLASYMRSPVGCLLHVVHLSVNAGMDTPFFMGPLGKCALHYLPRQHLFSLLVIIWYNTSRSDVATTT